MASNPADIPEVRFDDEVAISIFPRPIRKHAVLVRIPRTEDGSELPTYIRPNWGGVQVFYGDYYAVVTDGVVGYGSAKEQWLAMHRLLQPGYWVKTAIPTAYQATEVCRIVTLIPSHDGDIREASYTLQLGDWIVRQPGGEVQHVRAEVFENIYFSQEEVQSLQLTDMPTEKFAEWAIAQARGTVEA